MQQFAENVYKSEPRLIGEVIKDLIREGLILPNYKSKDYGRFFDYKEREFCNNRKYIPQG